MRDTCLPAETRGKNGSMEKARKCNESPVVVVPAGRMHPREQILATGRRRRTEWLGFECAKTLRSTSRVRASTTGKTGRSRQEQAVDKTPHQNASCSPA